jgi:hypothetical protein
MEIERNNPHASLMAVSGSGYGKDRMFITFYKDYSAYTAAMRLARQIAHASVDSLESFLVDQRQEQLQASQHVGNIRSHSLSEEGDTQ